MSQSNTIEAVPAAEARAESSGLTRRSALRGGAVLFGAAWAAPVIASVVSAPAAAASETAGATLNATAAQVTGNAQSGQLEVNGIRITSADSQTIPANTRITVTIEYTGSDDTFDFRQYGTAPENYWLGINQFWAVTSAKTVLVFSTLTSAASTEPTIGAISWPVVGRPADGSIVFSATAQIPPTVGSAFPDGATLNELVIDQNQGTGTLTGPTSTTWPTAA